jgi:hypothetical protein
MESIDETHVLRYNEVSEFVFTVINPSKIYMFKE